ncbi:MAG: nucleoside hydrolase [Balneolaceae bacterium]|nr:nucleoside hydrolase [Balneolaceae bacterium]
MPGVRKHPVRKRVSGKYTEIRDHVRKHSFDGSKAVTFIIERAMAAETRPLTILAVGKLTNIALALEKEPKIADRVRLVWLESNYPEPGEYNQEADTTAMNLLLNSGIPFEMVTVRYGTPSGTTAVRVTKAQTLHRMPGKGPVITEPVAGRHGDHFDTFGNYSVNLFEHYEMYGEPPGRSLFDMAAVAIIKDPGWAESKTFPAPVLIDNHWIERPSNDRMITIWEHFHIYKIMTDFFETMDEPVLVGGGSP